MLIVKYYDYDHSDQIFKIKTVGANAIYHTSDNTVLVELTNEDCIEISCDGLISITAFKKET